MQLNFSSLRDILTTSLKFWDVPQSRGLGKQKTVGPLLVLQDSGGLRAYVSVLSFNGPLLFPCPAGGPGIFVKAAYISVNVHNVAVPLGAGRLPSSLLNAGPSLLLLGLVPDSRLLHTSPKSRDLGEFRGTSPFLCLWDVNRESLSPWVRLLYNKDTKAVVCPFFHSIVGPS